MYSAQVIIKQGDVFWPLASSGHTVLGECDKSLTPYSVLNTLLAWRETQQAQRIRGAISYPAGDTSGKQFRDKAKMWNDLHWVKRMGLEIYCSYFDAPLKCGVLGEQHMTHVYLVTSNRSHVKS